MVLCCPEDVEHCGGAHGEEEICKMCRAPLCSDCRWRRLQEDEDNFRSPMSLANDNMRGYTCSIIAKYKVRWIEMAVVLPFWTSMIVYYVEGDRGHLMHEKIGSQQNRWAMRGNCLSGCCMVAA